MFRFNQKQSAVETIKVAYFFVDPESILSDLNNLPSDDGLGILDYVSSPTDTLEKEFVNLKMPL